LEDVFEVIGDADEGTRALGFVSGDGGRVAESSIESASSLRSLLRCSERLPVARRLLVFTCKSPALRAKTGMDRSSVEGRQ
jgi:hypothetical protein